LIFEQEEIGFKNLRRLVGTRRTQLSNAIGNSIIIPSHHIMSECFAKSKSCRRHGLLSHSHHFLINGTGRHHRKHRHNNNVIITRLVVMA